MGSFFRSVSASFARHDQTIRESLLANLSENIKEIQFEYSDESNQGITYNNLILFFNIIIESSRFKRQIFRCPFATVPAHCAQQLKQFSCTV